LCEKCFIKQCKHASLGKRYSDDEKKRINKKRIKTNMENHGYDHPMHSEDVVKKREKNFIGTLGVDNPWKNKDVIKKIQKTNNKKELIKMFVSITTLILFIF
jgi:hypothetical protein